MQSVQLQREIGNIEKAMQLVQDGINKYPNSYKLWLIKAQLYEQTNQIEKARETYEEGIKSDGLKMNKYIWICYAQFEINQEAFTRARTIL